MKRKALIIDDEAHGVQVLLPLLESGYPDIEVVGTAENVAMGIQQITRHQPDVVFLDISMPDGTGFQLLERVDRTHFHVIFTTAYDTFAVKAFEYSALHYLLKPIDAPALSQAIERLLEAPPPEKYLDTQQMAALKANLQTSFHKLALPHQEGFDLVEIKNILRCEACDGYTWFYLVDGTNLLVTKPITYYETLLHEEHFFRIHRKHLVNLNHVRSYRKGRAGHIVLNDGSTVEVSYRRREELLATLETLLRF